jgi:hypothetical protein
MRRFKRLKNAFSKKVESHAHVVALHLMCRQDHQRAPPNGSKDIRRVTDGLWQVLDIVGVLEDWERRRTDGRPPEERGA